MSLSPEDRLRELELLPVWRRRAGPDVAKVIATAATAPAVPVPEPVPAQSEPAQSEPAQSAPAQCEPAHSEPAQSEPAASVEVVDAGPDVDLPLDERRRAAIMTMDWEALQESVSLCQACGLSQTRTRTVFGVGDPQADWLFIGEAPGADEDRRGEPFVGAAGQLLDNMLAAIQLKRGDNVYIANVLKCRPPQNRDPHGEEVVRCDPYLKRQVALIRPRLIVALGRFAAQSVLDTDASIASLRGKLHDYQGVPVLVTYHPAYLLRNLPDKLKAWEDLCFARTTMQRLQSVAASPSE